MVMQPLEQLRPFLHRMKLTCAPVAQYFTRDSKSRIFQSLRCPGAGSCFNDRCGKLQRNETIPELELTTRFPGYATCARSCAGIMCGCLLPMASCSFYRFVYVPRSKTVYTVVQCVDWNPTVTIDVEATIFKVTKSQHTLEPYVEQNISDFKMTVISVQKPVSVFMNRKFALSPVESFVIPENYRLPIQCATEEIALRSFNACSTDFTCICHGTRSKTSCYCPDESIAHIRSATYNTLPIHTLNMEIQSKNGGIIMYSNKAEVLLAVQSKPKPKW